VSDLCPGFCSIGSLEGRSSNELTPAISAALAAGTLSNAITAGLSIEVMAKG
jgi:hypothetical protein